LQTRSDTAPVTSTRELRGRAVKIKGTTLLDSIAAAKRREGEQRYAAILALLAPEFRSLFEAEIYDTSWYSLDAFVAFLEAGLCYTGDDPTVLTRRAEALIERQLTGIYRVFVNLRDPEYIVQRVATIHRVYFSGTSVEVTTEDRHAVIRYVGFKAQHWLLDHTLIGFYRKALDMCGARDIVAKMTIPIAEGRAHSELQVSWRPSGTRPSLPDT
jgi:hypothetical protein